MTSIKKLIPALILFICFAQFLFAGGIFISDKGILINDSEESIIDFKDGIQHMVIQSGFRMENEENNYGNEKEKEIKKLFWILPIPGDEKSISVKSNNIKVILNMKEIDESLNKYSYYGIRFLLWSQLYTIPLDVMLMHVDYNYENTKYPRWQFFYKNITNNENYNISTELLPATNIEQISIYFQNNGIILDEKERELLNKYIGRNFSFVISKLDNYKEYLEKNKNSNLGRRPFSLFVSFRTDKIFYPVQALTYEKNSYVFVKTIGFSRPILKNQIKRESNIINGYYNGEISSNNKYFTKNKNGFLSEIMIKDPSIQKEDLYFERELRTDLKIKAFFINKYFFFLFYIIASILASGLAGKLVFKLSDKKELLKISLFGFANILTIILFVIIVDEMKDRFSVFKRNIKNISEEKVRKIFVKAFLSLFIIMSVLIAIFIREVGQIFFFETVALFVAFIGSQITLIYFYSKKIIAFISLFSILFLLISAGTLSLYYLEIGK